MIQDRCYKKVSNKKGIKVLSLFFIDKVSNYREYDKDNNPIKGKYAYNLIMKG